MALSATRYWHYLSNHIFSILPVKAKQVGTCGLEWQECSCRYMLLGAVFSYRSSVRAQLTIQLISLKRIQLCCRKPLLMLQSHGRLLYHAEPVLRCMGCDAFLA